MACLDKLSIMGIRSFGPNKDQKIQFFTPLTLIVGPNGTGKTTVIECLRYITTGEMPPGANKDAAFIHDPKVAQKVEVKAQVRLGFRDSRGKKVVTTRCLVASQKEKKIMMKSLEGTICRTDDSGESVQISSKCAELDREMMTCFGISKAILTNVIFCHQEDSTWPLSESKALKVKFDEIFAATRYVKALDAIYKLKQEHESQAKLFKTELGYLETNKKRAAKLRADLKLTETRLSDSREQVQRINEKLQPIDERLVEINSKEQSIASVQSSLDKKETELKLTNEACTSLARAIKQRFDGSKEELREQQRNIKSQLEDKENDQREVEQKLEKVKRETPPLVKKREGSLILCTTLKNEMEHHASRIKHRDKLLRDLCTLHKLEEMSSQEPLTHDDAAESMNRLKEVMELKKAGLERLKNEYDAKEKEVQSNLMSVRDGKTKLEHTIVMRDAQIRESRKEIQAVKNKLIDAEASVARLQVVENKLKSKEKDLEIALTEMNGDALQAEIRRMQDRASSLDTLVRKLDEEMMKLHQNSAQQTELNLAEKEKASKEESIRKLKARHSDTLTELLGQMPSGNFCSAIEEFTAKLMREKKSLSARRDALIPDIATLESERKSKMQELKKKEEDLRDCEEKLFQNCGSKGLDLTFREVETSLQELQEENASLSGTKYVYSQFLNKLKQKEPCCPLCHRDFVERQDVDDLVTELDKKLRLFPNEVEAKQKALREEQEKYNSLLVLKPVEERVKVLEKKQIPELRRRIKDLEGDLGKQKSDLAKVEESLKLKKNEEAAVASIQSDLVLIDQNESELNKINRRISAANESLGLGSMRKMDEVSQEKAEIQKQLDETQQSSKQKQEKLGEFQAVTQTLRADINKLGAEQVQVSRDSQQVAQLEGRKVELEKMIALNLKEIEESKTKLAPYEESIQIYEKEARKLVSQKEAEVEKSQHIIRELQNDIGEIEQYHKAILRFIDGKQPERLEKTQKDLDDVSHKLEELNAKQKDLMEQDRTLMQELDKQETNLRNLKNNMELKLKEEKVEAVRQDVAELKARLGGFDIFSLQKEKRNLAKQEETLKKDLHKAEGKEHELEENIRRVTADLNGDFKDAEKNYKDKLIKFKVTSVASSDLLKYYTALDGAIMQYHALKMKEINKILKDLWISTYRGTDIDYIAIKADDEIKAQTTTRRRQYQYRVVMVKGGIELDMRGRCSTGQRVLASLLIRLALAETFCLTCGVLALDEPTTNLDEDNVASLAEALKTLVRNRSQYKNFQLIVITHDEGFSQQLGYSDFVDYYYRISKDENGHSVIKKYADREDREVDG